MTKQIEALNMAILQFERINKEYDCTEIIDICKEALEQPAQEPVLLNVKTHDDKTYKVEVSALSWQGLSDDELSKLFAKCGWVEEGDNLRELGFYRHARMLEQALKEKNNAV